MALVRLLMLTLLVSTNSCSKAKDEQGTPPTPDYARLQSGSLVRIIDAALKSDDWREFDSACDLEEFTRRVIGTTVVSFEIRNLIRLMIQGGQDIEGVIRLPSKNEIRNLTLDGNHAAFLRVRMEGGRPQPLYRILTRVGGLDYCAWVLAPDNSPKPRVIDAYSFIRGELFSAYVRRLLLPKPDRLDILNSLKVPTPMDLYSAFPERYNLVELVMARRYSEALSHFESQKVALMEDKHAHLLRMESAIRVDPGAHVKAFEEFEGRFPGDPSLPMLRTSYLINSGKYDQALLAVDAIEGLIGGDKYLASIRALVQAAAGRVAIADELARRCTDAEPSIAEGWYARISIRLRENDAEGAMRLLVDGIKSSRLAAARVEALPGFDVLSGSEAYRAWRSSLETK